MRETPRETAVRPMSLRLRLQSSGVRLPKAWNLQGLTSKSHGLNTWA
jgi:hypothetical protein